MGARILVVEDDPDLHISLALRLKSAGHIVTSALDGREGILVALREQPDVMILDVGLPGCNGHDVAKELSLHAETRGIPIIFLTARHETDHRLQAAQNGAAAYLVKPAMPGTLFSAIDAALIARQTRE